MRTIRSLLVIAAVLAPLSARAAPDVVVRTTLDPAAGAVVGQPVRLLVDVLYAGAMPRPPRVRIGDAPGLQILRFETQAVTMNDRIDGRDYAGQRFEFVAFPRRGGDLAVPAAEVTLLDAAGEPTGTARGEPAHLAARVPPGIDASGPVLAATAVSATQTWQPDPAGAFAPGGAVTRTIRRQAAGVPALGMADFAFTAPDGVRIYVDPPQADDRVTRGEVTGSRVDKITYVFERAGRFELPPLTQPWWDLDDSTARRQTLAGVTVNVAASGQVAQSPRRRLRIPAFAVAGLLALVGGWFVGAKLVAVRRERRRAGAGAEAIARAALRQAAGSGEPGATYRALMAWLESLAPAARPLARDDPALGPAIERLERHLFGSGAGWSRDDGASLARAVADMAGRHPSPDARRATAVALPPLNPAVPI